MNDPAERHADQAFGAWLIVGILLATVVGLGSAWWMAQPDRSVDPYTRLAAEIGCQCGTCPKRPIATCGCAYAGGMLGELRELVATGQDDDAIMATFVARYDPSIRIRPAGRGFDLTAWAAPMLLLTVGIVAVVAVLARWVATSSPAVEADAPTDAPDPAAERLREQVERELADLDV